MKKIGVVVAVVVLLSMLIGVIGCEPEAGPAGPTIKPEPTAQPEPTEVKPIKVRHADYRAHKPGYFGTITELGPWEQAVPHLTDGRIEIDVYDAGQLFGAAVTIRSVTAGVSEAAFLSSSYLDEVPLLKGMRLPPVYDEKSATQNNCFFWFYCQDIFAPHWAEQNIIDLGHLALHPYLMMTAKTPVRNTADLAGVTLISRDETVISLFSEYGSIMQPIGNLDGYEALSKGIADGGVWNWEGPALFGWWDAFDPGYYIDMGGVVRSGGGSNCIMNLDFWNSLPADLQEDFGWATWYWASMEFAAWIDDSALAFKREAAKRGIQYIVWSDAEKQILNDRKEDLIQEWVDMCDKDYGLGAEAEEIVARYRKAAQEYVPPAHIPSQWQIGADQAEKDKLKAEWDAVFGEGSTWGAGYKAYPNQVSTTEVTGGVPEAWPEGTYVMPVNPLAE